MFIELCFKFVSIFYMFIPHVVSYFFSFSPLVQVVQSCHSLVYLRYILTYLGSIGYFLAQDPVLPNDCSLKKLMLNRESRVCSLLSLIMYPKHVYFASLTLTAEYWRSG
jgi:hypothetical protein